MAPSENHPAPPPKTTLVGWGQNVLLLCLSLVIALTAIELALRVYNPFGFRIKGNKVILPVNKNEVRPHPNARKLDRILTVHRNSLGFRGAEPPRDFSRYLTLITVGGSTTECRELADDKTWPYFLEQKLKKDFQPLWLNNAGLSGHSTFGHAALMEDYISKIKPNVVIFLVGINEIGLADLNAADKNIAKGLSLSSFRSLERFLAGMSDYSETAALLLNLKRYFFPKVEVAITYNEIDLAAAPTLELTHQARLSLIKQYGEKFLQAFQSRLENLLQISRAHGIIPVLMTQPALYGEVTDDVTGVYLGKIRATKHFNGAVAWEILELYNDVTRRVGKEEQALVIDLARELPKSSRYYYDLNHFTNAGAEQVGEIAASQLRPFLAKLYPQNQARRPEDPTASPLASGRRP